MQAERHCLNLATGRCSGHPPSRRWGTNDNPANWRRYRCDDNCGLCFTNIGHNLVAAPLNMESEAEHGVQSASYVASSAKSKEFSQHESSAFPGEEVDADAPETS